MSFILDALKKLDHKRQRGSVPDLMTVHEPMPQELKRRSLWLYLFLGVLLLNVSVMLLWLYPWQSKKPASLQGEAGTEASSTTAVKKAADLPAGRQGSTLRDKIPVNSSQNTSDVHMPASDVPASQNKNENLNPETKQSVPAQAADLPAEQAGSAVPKRAGIEVNEAEIRQNLKKEAEEQNKILNEQETASLSHPSDSPAGQAGLKQRSVTEGSQNKEIPYLDELPLSVRQELPTLTIAAHIYSNNSASRMANINGRTVREGQNVADGIKLEEITLNGVILSYRDYRFRIRM
ncbi:MAG: general secretion pathway protein GspB [Nitrospirota bacterium]